MGGTVVVVVLAHFNYVLNQSSEGDDGIHQKIFCQDILRLWARMNDEDYRLAFVDNIKNLRECSLRNDQDLLYRGVLAATRPKYLPAHRAWHAVKAR